MITVQGIVDDTSRVKTREVERPSGLELTSLEAERVREKFGTGGGAAVRSVVIEGNRCEVGVRKLVVSHVGTVDLELQLVGVTEHGHSRSVSSRQVLDGVVEVKFLDLGTGGNRLLHLGDEHVLGRAREHLTFLGIEVRVVGIDFPLVGIRGGTPSDAELHIVVLEGDEREGGLPVLTESEPERVEPLRGGSGVETTGDRLGGGGRREGGGDESRVGRVLFIDHLATDEEFHLGNGSGPIGDGVRLGTIGLDGHEVHIVEHITLALEADGGHTVVRDVALNDLTLDSLGKICVTLVRRPEKADFGLTDKVHILGTDSNELGNTTRHFII